MFYLVFKLGTIQRMVKGTHALWSACFPFARPHTDLFDL